MLKHRLKEFRNTFLLVLVFSILGFSLVLPIFQRRENWSVKALEGIDVFRYVDPTNTSLTLTEWESTQGASPYLDEIDASYIHEDKTASMEFGWFDFHNISLTGDGFSVNVSFYCIGDDGNDGFEIYYDIGGGSTHWETFVVPTSPLRWVYSSSDLTLTADQVNDLQVMLDTNMNGGGDDIYVYAMRIGVYREETETWNLADSYTFDWGNDTLPTNLADTITWNWGNESLEINAIIDSISPYIKTSSPLTITATDHGFNNSEWVTLYYRYSDDNATWGGDFSYRKLVTLSDKLDDYQFCVNISNATSSESDLNCSGNLEQSNFNDIRFLAYSDNSTYLPYWIEYIDETNGHATFWINNSVNTTKFWFIYGNSTCGNESNMSKTWDWNISWEYDKTGDFSLYTSSSGIRYTSRVMDMGKTFDLDDKIRLLSSVAHVYRNIPNQYGVRAGIGLHYNDDDYHDSNDYFLFFDGVDNDWTQSETRSELWTKSDGVDTAGANNPYYEFPTAPTLDQFNSYEMLCNNTHINITYREDHTKGELIENCQYNTSENITTDPLQYFAYDSYLGSDDIGANDFWEYRSSTKSIRWGAFNSGRCTIKLESKWSVIGKWNETETTISSVGSEESGSGWEIWSDASNPDKNSPWSWDFDFPDGEGYYEVFARGNDSDYTETLQSTREELFRYVAGAGYHLADSYTFDWGNDTLPTNLVDSYTFDWGNDSIVLQYGETITFDWGNATLPLNLADTITFDWGNDSIIPHYVATHTFDWGNNSIALQHADTITFDWGNDTLPSHLADTITFDWGNDSIIPHYVATHTFDWGNDSLPLNHADTILFDWGNDTLPSHLADQYTFDWGNDSIVIQFSNSYTFDWGNDSLPLNLADSYTFDWGNDTSVEMWNLSNWYNFSWGNDTIVLQYVNTHTFDWGNDTLPFNLVDTILFDWGNDTIIPHYVATHTFDWGNDSIIIQHSNTYTFDWGNNSLPPNLADTLTFDWGNDTIILYHSDTFNFDWGNDSITIQHADTITFDWGNNTLPPNLVDTITFDWGNDSIIGIQSGIFTWDWGNDSLPPNLANTILFDWGNDTLPSHLSDTITFDWGNDTLVDQYNLADSFTFDWGNDSTPHLSDSYTFDWGNETALEWMTWEEWIEYGIETGIISEDGMLEISFVENILILIIALVLLGYGLWITKKSGGIFIVLSGSLFVGLVLVGTFTIAFTSIIVALGLIVIILGVYKLFYSDKKNKESG